MGPGDNEQSSGDGLLGAIGSNFDLSKIAQIVVQLDNAASLMLKQFGQAQSMSSIIRRTMAETVTDVRRLGGDIDDIIRTQSEASEALGRNVLLSSKTSKDLFATMSVTGQSVKEIVGGMADAGISSSKATNEMLKVVNIARESGVNAQAVSGEVLKNMNALNKYNFAGGVEGLSKMASQAAGLRINMKDSLDFAERVFDPEGAIKMAAAMQRLGVSQSALLDPLKLMDLSQNDPAELQNQIAQMSKQFVQLGKDGHFEIMPGAKRQLREIAKEMEIPYDTLTKMALGGAELDKKLKEIKLPEGIANEQQMKMIANMAEMDEGGNYTIKIEDPKTGEIITKGLSELSAKDVTNLETIANRAPKTMEEYAKEQLSTSVSMAADIASLADRTGTGVAAASTTTKGLALGRATTASLAALPSENLSTKNIAKGIDSTMGKVSDILHNYSNNLISNGEAISQTSDLLKGFGSFMSDEFMTSFKNLKTEADKLDKQFPVIGDMLGSFKRLGREVGVLPPSSGSAPSSGGGTTNGGGTNNTQASNTTSTVNVNHNLNLNLTNPGTIDAKQLISMFNDTAVAQAMGTATREIFNNGGLTAPTSNKQQFLNT
jgi:hypothetical protein